MRSVETVTETIVRGWCQQGVHDSPELRACAMELAGEICRMAWRDWNHERARRKHEVSVGLNPHHERPLMERRERLRRETWHIERGTESHCRPARRCRRRR